MSLLSIHDLGWTPQGGSQVLHGLDLEIEAGELVVVSGESGCGKSSLLRCMVRLQPWDAGELLWEGQTVEPEGMCAFRRRVRLVDQQPVAVAETIGENLAFAREQAGEIGLDEAEQRKLLARLGIEGWESAKSFERFSVGERQRIAFVRALTGRPQVLLLDEPTAALDPARVAICEELLLDYLSGDGDRALVWVSHDPLQAERLPGRHLVLEGGVLRPA